MTKQARLVHEQCDVAVVDLSDNVTTVFDGPCMLYGVYVDTVLSGEVCPIQDGSQAERTNLALYSQDFTNAAWTETNTDQPSQVIAPDGTATADEIAATSTADQAFAIYQGFTGLTAAQATTVSCHLKPGVNATLAQLAWDSDGSGADGLFCNFNLSTGVAGTVTALAAGTATSAAIKEVDKDYYRCSIVGSIAVGTVGRLTLSISDNIAGAVFEAADLTDNDSIYAWGAQAETEGGVTAYIPTTDTIRGGNYPPVVLPATLAAGTNLTFPGIRFENSLVVNPDDSATGEIRVTYRRVNPN